MITANVASLNFDLSKILDKAKDNASQVARAIALELETRVVLKSPVDSGRLRGNWNVGINSIDTAEKPADKTGSSSNTRAISSLSKFKLGDTIWITNNLPYVQKLEFGLYGNGAKTINGYSMQAPHGFIRITFKEVQSAFDSIGKKAIK